VTLEQEQKLCTRRTQVEALLEMVSNLGHKKRAISSLSHSKTGFRADTFSFSRALIAAIKDGAILASLRMFFCSKSSASRA
jgi:hypothetical protein